MENEEKQRSNESAFREKCRNEITIIFIQRSSIGLMVIKNQKT